MNEKNETMIDECEETAKQEEFYDEVDEVLADAFDELLNEAYKEAFEEAYPSAYDAAIEAGKDPEDARDIAKEQAHKNATGTARDIASDQLVSISHDLIRDVCDRHGIRMTSE